MSLFKRTCVLLALASSGAVSLAQNCSQVGNLTCGSPNDPTSGASEAVSVLIGSIPTGDYPLNAFFYPQFSNGVPAGWSSSGTLPFAASNYGGAAGLSSADEGKGSSMIVHYSFTRQLNGQVALTGQCPAVDIYWDALEDAAFTWTLQAVDCASGVFRMVLADNPSDPGDITQAPYTGQVNYALTRNGNAVASGALSGIATTNPASLVLNNLTAGNYQLTLTDNNAAGGFLYCPSTYQRAFVVPGSGDCGVNVALKACLQGALPSGTVMTDALRTANVIPTTEPYTALGYGYTGIAPGATIDPAMLAVTGNDAIEDWVVVELRNSANSAQVLFSRPALLQRDGDVMDLDGNGYVNFPNASGSYFVALRHRNHLGVMTASPIALGLSPVTVDLLSATTACYGSVPRALVGSTYCLWAADATGDGSLKYTGSGNDRDPIILAVGGTTPNNVVSNVYDRRDTNLDGVIKYTGTGNDRDIILTNVGSTTPNNTRTQQLP